MKFIFLLLPALLFGEVELEELKVVDDYKLQDETLLENAPMQTQFSVDEALNFAGTNGDPLKAIQTLAGVTTTSNDGGELIIHGSKPRETIVTIDHLPIGYIFHLGGLYSVIAPEATRQIDAYLGGFDTTYYGMGAVIDVKPKYPVGSGNGRVHIGMYDADFALDVPLSEKWSLFLGGRRSYFDLIAEDLIDELEKNDDDEEEKLTFTLFPRFWDFQLLSYYEIDSRNSLSFEAIFSKDELKLHSTMQKDKDPVANGKINQSRGFETYGFRWKYGDEVQKSHTLLYYLHNYLDMELFDSDFKIDVITKQTGLFHETVWDIGKHKSVLGFELVHEDSPIDVNSPKHPDADDFDYYMTDEEIIRVDKDFEANTKILFFQDTWEFADNWKARCGIRGTHTDFQDFGGVVDFRHALIWEASEDRSFSFSGGTYSQFPEPSYVIEGFGNDKIDTYEKSIHYAFNWTEKFVEGSLKLEPYYKKFTDLVIEDNETLYNADGDGYAYGVDITYEYKKEDFSLILAYTYIRAEREIQGGELHRFYGEIPHTLQANALYKFSNGWNVSGLLKYASGTPYTEIIKTETYTYEGKEYHRPIYGTPFGKRLPETIDLDVQVGKEFGDLEFAVELLNLSTLFHENVSSVKYNDEYKKDGYYYQMPFFPAFHLTYRF
jgi:hypothetical protein